MKTSLLLVWVFVYRLRSVPAYGTSLEASRNRQPRKKVLFALLFLLIHGLSGTARADTILLGSDYLAAVRNRVAGEFDFGPINFPGLGTVDLGLFNVRGVRPFGRGPLGNTDTIIQRLENGTGFSGTEPQRDPFERATVRARLQSMALQSDGPVLGGGEAFNAFLMFTSRGEASLTFQDEFDGFNGTVDFALPATLEILLRPIGRGDVFRSDSQPVVVDLQSGIWDSRPD
jgi:hypothetical protein